MKKINPESENIYEPFIDDLFSRNSEPSGNIIPYLQAVQNRYNYLPAQAFGYLSQKSGIEENRILSIATFYKQFRLTPAGEHTVKVCVGTACHVNGAEKIYTSFLDNLNITDGEDTDSDRKFSIVKAACLGCCMLAPAVQIDDRTYGFVDADNTGGILESFLREEASGNKKAERTPGTRKAESEILICRCSSCLAAGALQIEDAINDTIGRYKLDMDIRQVGCTGLSYKAPYFEIHSGNSEPFRAGNADPGQIDSLLLKYAGKKSVKNKIKYFYNHLLDKILNPSDRGTEINESGDDSEYTGKQKQIATEHAGLADPLSLDEYIARDGLKALNICLSENDPGKTIDIIRDSGLRGRGGAGFPSADKWEKLLNAGPGQKYLICNADEGDPGAFMDRLLLESFPLRVLEGIAIACLTLSVKTAIIYVRAEYPLAAVRIKKAIQLCMENRVWGADADNTKLGFEIKVVEGAGAFVCGEETALIAAVQGERGIPSTRPPYPSEKGLFGFPTLINNVETFALLPWIIRSDKSGFRNLGTAKSRGTKTFALAGKIKRSGLIEVPMGISIAEIVKKIGGGMKEGSIFKAVQIGGPAGGCIPASLADSKIDYDSLRSLGAIMGSGGLVVLDQNDCIVELARYFMEFAVEESCGRCVYCRVGCRRMLELLEKLTNGTADSGTLERLEQTALLVKERSKCGLGKGSVNPFLSGLKHFRDEYEAHVKGTCPAGHCRELIRFKINPDLCIGCTKCAQACPSGAITANPYRKQIIDNELCIKCGSCRQVCPQGAVDVS